LVGLGCISWTSESKLVRAAAIATTNEPVNLIPFSAYTISLDFDNKKLAFPSQYFAHQLFSCVHVKKIIVGPYITNLYKDRISGALLSIPCTNIKCILSLFKRINAYRRIPSPHTALNTSPSFQIAGHSKFDIEN